jgi:hypothetical protein
MNLNQIITSIGWLGFLICFCIIIFFKKCDKPIMVTEKLITVLYDTIPKPVPSIKYLPGKPIPQLIPAKVDTQKIIAQFFSKQPYTRSFKNDTIDISIDDTLFNNQFFSKGNLKYKWLIPFKTTETITTTTVTPPKSMFLIGLHINGSSKQVLDVGPDIFFKTKNNKLFGIGYDIKSENFRINAAIPLQNLFKK